MENAMETEYGQKSLVKVSSVLRPTISTFLFSPCVNEESLLFAISFTIIYWVKPHIEISTDPSKDFVSK